MSYDHKKYIKEYYQRNKETIKAKGKVYYLKNAERIKVRVKNSKTPEQEGIYRKRLRAKTMFEIFTILGMECEICKEKDKKVLQIDHIDGGGRKHMLRQSASISTYYKSILTSLRNKEGKYRLLCSNCNIREAINKGFRGCVWDYADSFFNELLK